MILFGGLFAVLGCKDKSLPILKDSFFWHGVLFSSIFNVAVVYAIVYYPDWMWMYYLSDSHNSLMELIYLFIFLYYLPYMLGFYIVRDLKQKSFKYALSFMGLMLITEVWLVWHLFERYSVVGTRTEYLAGNAISLFAPQNPIGPVMNGSVACLVVYYIGVLYFYKKKSRSS